MNFFEQQEKARKRTFVLLFFYALAVIGTIAAVYGAVRIVWFFVLTYGGSHSQPGHVIPFEFWDPKFFLIVMGVVCAVVLTGSAAKLAQLSSGGASVASMLGGEQIMPNTTDPDERKVLNVVEEMSIASGVPVPPVYLLKNEFSINAFAAGFSMRDAVIAVTQGTVKLLTRDELQGVIAHEFSHIFNGDMRLNMNLMGFLNGLLLIALTGKFILQGMGRGRVRSSGRGGGGGALLVIGLLAILLMVVGYVGVFFCNWIKSAVSRERELLADASSAQYTRNPLGLAGALKKIAGLSDGSLIHQVAAEETSHFFFADGTHWKGMAVFPTHPPLELRIKLLDPSFDGEFPEVASIAPKVKPYQPRKTVRRLDTKAQAWQRKLAIFQLPMAAAVAQTSLADSVVSQVGTVSKNTLGEAGHILEGLPRSLKLAVESLSGAVAVVYGLLADRSNTEVRTRQLEYLSKNADPAVYQTFLNLLPDFSYLPLEYRLPLLDLATPALKTQSAALYEGFREHVEALINMDSKVTPFEFTLKQVMLSRLDFFFGKTKKAKQLYASLNPLISSCEVLLSFLAGAGNAFGNKAEQAFIKASKMLAGSRVWKFIPRGEISPQKVETALKEMASAFPKCKEQFLKACVGCVEQDGKLDLREMELLRAFASALDCPIPPITISALK